MWIGRLINAKGSSALVPQWIAVANRLRPAMDDWVRRDCLESVTIIARERDLHILPDVAFFPPGDISSVRGATRLNTTISRGRWWTDAEPSDRVHIFVGTTQAAAEEAARWGWYPVISGNHLLTADPRSSGPFGNAMGYPSCCVDAFRVRNRWDGLGHFHRLPPASVRLPALNFLGRHLGLAWIFHVPCGWDCAPSLALAEHTRRVFEAEDPEAARRIASFCTGRFLVISELACYRLEPCLWLAAGGRDDWGRTLARGRVVEDQRGQVMIETPDGQTTLLSRLTGYAAELPVLWTFGGDT